MEAGLVTGTRTVELLEMPEPSPGDGQAVVHIHLCGVCGTDIHSYQAGNTGSPAICGHEWVGTVAALGPGVSAVREGDRVIGGIAPACGQCDACRAGYASHCPMMMASLMGGGQPHGGFARAVAVDARRLTPAPDALTDVEAAMVEPLTVALHGLRRTRFRLGDTALVLGAGPIGLMMIQCARAAGAGRLLAVEPVESRAKLARELGADVVLNPNADDVAARVAEETGGLGPDVVFECAGISPTIQTAVDLVRRGGAVTLVGLSNDNATINPGVWLSKEVTFTGSVAYLHEEFGMAASLIADGRVKVTPLHSRTAPLHEIADAFEQLDTDRSQIKVLIDPRT